MTKDIVKEYGDVIHDPSSITDQELKILSVSPKIDIALGGGVPEGSLFIMTGPVPEYFDQSHPGLWIEN